MDWAASSRSEHAAKDEAEENGEKRDGNAQPHQGRGRLGFFLASFFIVGGGLFFDRGVIDLGGLAAMAAIYFLARQIRAYLVGFTTKWALERDFRTSGFRGNYWLQCFFARRCLGREEDLGGEVFHLFRRQGNQQALAPGALDFFADVIVGHGSLMATRGALDLKRHGKPGGGQRFVSIDLIMGEDAPAVQAANPRRGDWGNVGV
jgi:hypothetical protein